MTKIINVSDFGAVGDGINDDTKAIKDAIGNGGEINFGYKNTYLLTDTVLIDKNSDINLNGSIILFNLAKNVPGFSVKSDDVRIDNGTIRVTGQREACQTRST